MLEIIVPSLVVFGTTAIVVAATVIVVRVVRRGPRARAAAERVRAHAAAALVHLDDAIEDADVELGLAAAVSGGGAPASLARARVAAVRIRDDGFARFRQLSDDPTPIPVLKRDAARLATRADEAVAELRAGTAEHAAWLAKNADARGQIAAAQARLAQVRLELGNPETRRTDLLERFHAEEVDEVIAPMANAAALLSQAETALQTAAAVADDPTTSALDDLAEAERALRAAEHEVGMADQAFEQIRRAASALPSEIASLRALMQSGATLRAGVPQEAADAIAAALREAQQRVDELEAAAARRPIATITGLTRVRDRLDLALGDARSARARLEGAKAALPGTLATARIHIARAEAALQETPAPDAQIRLAAAREELALARNASDVVEALDAGRRAVRHAEDAAALVAYARMQQG